MTVLLLVEVARMQRTKTADIDNIEYSKFIELNVIYKRFLNIMAWDLLHSVHSVSDRLSQRKS